ncbi:MAG: 1,6-anhydro-N-acetylmuramyl-L-alanine amidase AmpD [Zoogloeaceae bacterium]|jgi:AmpD protein|nr:1,6-anhydro-N-acetylmuramyl-L-alanine amidase AmpD [Zoogloeaceae bacterium]
MNPHDARWLAGWLSSAARLDSPNFGPRPADVLPWLIVIHAISLPPGEFGGNAVPDFFLNRLDAHAHPYFQEIAGLEVSSHFFIRRDGKLMQFVSIDERAWHAGQSVWRDQPNCNDFSVGIELEGDDATPYESAQYATLFALIDALQAVLPITDLAGHCHIAPGRKTDPGPFFDWETLKARFPACRMPAPCL